MRTLLRAEAGSALLLHLFLIVCTLLAVGVIADVGSVIGARQSLAATADQAALAGAQAVDLDAFYTDGADGLAGLPLQPAAVESTVARFLAPAIAQQQPPGLELGAVEVADGTVTVRLRSRASLPFTALLGLESVPVSAAAEAQLHVQPQP